jgi:hypothetical protein
MRLMTAGDRERMSAAHNPRLQSTRTARELQASEQGRHGALLPLGLWPLGDAFAGALAFLLALLAR